MHKSAINGFTFMFLVVFMCIWKQCFDTAFLYCLASIGLCGISKQGTSRSMHDADSNIILHWFGGTYT